MWHASRTDFLHKFKIYQNDIFIIFALCRVIENAFRNKKAFRNINIISTVENEKIFAIERKYLQK